MVSPTVSYSYTLDRGWTWIETYFTAQFFTNNNNFFVNGAQTLSQNPIFRVEEHISRNLTDRFWLATNFITRWSGTARAMSIFVDLSEALVSPRCDDCHPFYLSRWLFALSD